MATVSPTRTPGAVESPDAEVARVVELVLGHAAVRPHESLVVVTASQAHAVRVLQAVLVAANDRPELADFLSGDRAEPFAVSTIEQAVAESRDRVIFSIGYGRTPHGRVLSDFGSSARRAASGCSRVAMTRARAGNDDRRLLPAVDIDESRMRYGAVALAEIPGRGGCPVLGQSPSPDDSDPMLVDLARRLEARGVITWRSAIAWQARHSVASHGRHLRHRREPTPPCCAGSLREEPAAPARTAAPRLGLARGAGALVRALQRPDAVAARSAGGARG